MRLLALPLFALFGLLSLASANDEFPIWPGLAPGSEGLPDEEVIVNERVRKVYQPTLTAFLPPDELATGAAVLIAPGGGYRHLAIKKEGSHIAAWLNSLGISAFVLKYRLDQELALEDALQAMRYLRENASNWNLDTDRLGMMGFSAGGHLLLNTVSHSEAPSRPDFLVVFYPVIEGIELSSAFAPKAGPSIVFGASDDSTTPPSNAISVYQTLVEQEQIAELHLFESGGHGFGLGLYRGPVDAWSDICEDWLERRSLLQRHE